MFVKLYDAATEQLTLKGTLWANCETKLAHLMPRLALLAGFDADMPLLVCEDKKYVSSLYYWRPIVRLRTQIFIITPLGME